MKRLLFIQLCLFLAVYNFDESHLNVAQAMDVNTQNLSTWLGSEMALHAAVNGGQKKIEIIEHCAKNKHEKSIEAACIIATRL